MRVRRTWMIASLLAAGLTLSGCESFDPESWFNPKKPLPGDRRPMFPGGVPGVPQGVPHELVKGYQPPPETPPEVGEGPAGAAAAQACSETRSAACAPAGRRAAPGSGSTSAGASPAAAGRAVAVPAAAAVSGRVTVPDPPRR